MLLPLAEAAVTDLTKHLVFLKNVVKRRTDAPSVLHSPLMPLSHMPAQAVSAELLTGEHSLLGFLLAGPRGAAQHRTQSERVAHPSLDPLGTCLLCPPFPCFSVRETRTPLGKLDRCYFKRNCNRQQMTCLFVLPFYLFFCISLLPFMHT